TYGYNAIDAALVVPGAQVELLLPILRNPLRMLDHLAVHIRDPQPAVRARLDHRRPKPIVARRQEFRLALVLRSAAGERHALRRHDFAVNQVMHRLADKHPLYFRARSVSDRFLSPLRSLT